METNRSRWKWKSLLVSVALIGLTSSAGADTVLDLTTAGADGTINAAQFVQIDAQSTGTGTINAFVNMQTPPGGGPNAVLQEHAYNTTVDGVLDNGSADTHNHAIQVSDIPVVTLSDGFEYRQFLLDIGEPTATSQISLDEIQIFTSTVPNQSVETFTGGIIDLSGTLIYRLDTPTSNNTILLDAALNSGQGSGDMFAYIRSDLFTGLSSQYVYLYSHFGFDPTAEGTFEEWGLLSPSAPVPEPGTMALFGIGLSAMVAKRMRRKQAV